MPCFARDIDWYEAGRNAYSRDLNLEDNEGRTLDQKAEWARGWSDAERANPFKPQPDSFEFGDDED